MAGVHRWSGGVVATRRSQAESRGPRRRASAVRTGPDRARLDGPGARGAGRTGAVRCRRQTGRPPDRRYGVVGGGYAPGGYAPARFDPARTRAFGLPNLRRNVCPHFYVTGARGALPDPRAAPAQGHRPPGQRRLALPAARRRPPRAELRQRRVPLAALQPVRLLRGGAERPLSRPGVRSATPRPPRITRPSGR